MPVTPAYTWTEASNELEVVVSLRGANPRTTDVFVSDVLLKLNAPGSVLLQLDLRHAVDEESASVRFESGGVTVTLVKAAPGIWGELKAAGTKAELTARRNASMEGHRARQAAKAAARAKEKQEEERTATRNDMARSTATKQLIEERKDRERTDAVEEVQRTLDTLPGKGQTAKAAAKPAQPAAAARAAEVPAPSRGSLDGRITAPGEPAAPAKYEKTYEEASKPLKMEQPSARQQLDEFAMREAQPSGSIDATAGGDTNGDIFKPDEVQALTTRGFREVASLPVRAPMQPLKMKMSSNKQPDHMKHLPARSRPEDEPKAASELAARTDDTVDLGEQNAHFLKDRADTFFKRKDYEGAANAYSAAITLDKALVAAYSNRAACHLQLSDYGASAKDCDKALGLIDEELAKLTLGAASGAEHMEQDELDRKQRSRLRLLARRGNARCMLNKHKLAAADYREALKLDPENEGLQEDLKAVEAVLQEEALTKLKAKADAAFRGQKFEEAERVYSEAISGAAAAAAAVVAEQLEKEDDAEEEADAALVGPTHTACLSNRAACRLLLGRDADCVEDCSDAMAALALATASAEADDPEQEKRAKSAVKLLARRAAALSRMGSAEAALADFAAAVRKCADPAEQARLQADADKLRARERSD